MSLLDGLTPDELAQAEAAVAQVRAADAADTAFEGRFSVERAPERPPTLVEQLDAEQDARDGEDFTAFWTARNRRGATLRNVVPGVHVELPAELPLAFEVEARRLANDRTLDAVHHLFGLLYGPGTLASLIEGGLTGEQLGVLLLWGAANGNGRALTLAEATAEFERMRAAAAVGKADAPPTDSGPTSDGTGGASRPTSPASTASTSGPSPH